MRLRYEPDGTPFVVLEAGDISAIARVRWLLVSASVQLAEEDGALIGLAGDLDELVTGKLPRIRLPGKRKKQEEPGGVFAPDGPLADGEPTSAPIPAVSRKTGPACPDCGQPLSKGELRQEREKCFLCAPIQEDVVDVS